MRLPQWSTDPHPPPGPVVLPREMARGGRIVLRRPWQRAVFIAGLVAAAVIGIVLLTIAIPATWS
jgi:hypothetical protein